MKIIEYVPVRPLMADPHLTTMLLQRCLNGLRNAAAQDAAIRDLLGHAVERLQRLCGGLLHHSYPGLTRPPLCLNSEHRLFHPRIP